MNSKTPLAHYIICDSGDGSASLMLFKTADAMNLYVTHLEETSNYIDLSEGGHALTQSNLDEALTIEQVLAMISQ